MVRPTNPDDPAPGSDAGPDLLIDDGGCGCAVRGGGGGAAPLGIVLVLGAALVGLRRRRTGRPG